MQEMFGNWWVRVAEQCCSLLSQAQMRNSICWVWLWNYPALVTPTDVDPRFQTWEALKAKLQGRQEGRSVQNACYFEMLEEGIQPIDGFTLDIIAITKVGLGNEFPINVGINWIIQCNLHMMKEQFPCPLNEYIMHTRIFFACLLSFRATAVRMVMWKQFKFKNLKFLKKRVFFEDDAKLQIFLRVHKADFALSKWYCINLADMSFHGRVKDCIS